ncbi:hypothetical protein AUJ14_05585 [Candidatus Micrarchaeota archaeon CG1_02_55_22]|nr:MAG: hypothetical protein AUJ14_05585 [Candidatus Micrarchaeota archaeon CG1_02_55_22]
MLAASVALLLAAVYAVTSNVFVYGTIQLNPLGPDWLIVAIMVLLAVVSGLLVASAVYMRSLRGKTCATGVAGGTLGFLSSACAYCPPVAAFFLGAQSLYFLSAYGLELSVAALAFAFYGLYDTLGS